MSNGIFYVTYALVKFPFTAAFYRSSKPATWLACTLALWSILTNLAAALQHQWAFYGYRILLGVVQSGCTPGIYLYLSQFIPNSHIALPLTIVELQQPVSQILSGPVSLLMPKINGVYGLLGYQWLFILIGTPGIVCGLLMLWSFP